MERYEIINRTMFAYVSGCLFFRLLLPVICLSKKERSNNKVKIQVCEGDEVSLKKKRGIKERVGQTFVQELKLYP